MMACEYQTKMAVKLYDVPVKFKTWHHPNEQRRSNESFNWFFYHAKNY